MGVFGLLFRLNGRITRSQLWLGQLAVIGALCLIFVIWGLGVATAFSAGLKKLPQNQQNLAALSAVWGLVLMGGIAALLSLWMGLALSFKRLHDRGKSGWWILAYGIPSMFAAIAPFPPVLAIAVIAKLWYIIELGFMKGDPGPNIYGQGTVSDPSALVARDLMDLQREHNDRVAAKPAGAGVVRPRVTVAAARAQPQGFGRRNTRTA